MTLDEAIAHYANKVDVKIGWLRSAVLNGDSNEAQAILNDIKEDASRLIWLKDLEQQEVEE